MRKLYKLGTHTVYSVSKNTRCEVQPMKQNKPISRVGRPPTPKGLTSHDIRAFSEMLVKANRDQLYALCKSVSAQIDMRVGVRA